VALLIAGTGLAAGLGWYFWRWLAAPAPPAVDLDDADPVVAAAVRTAQQNIRKDPYSVAAWGALGKLLRASGYLPDAAACFDQAGRLDPADPRWPYLAGEALAQRDPEAALTRLRRAVELCDRSGEENLAPRLRLAELLLARGPAGQAEAEAVLRRALEVDPKNPSAYLDLGLLAYERDELKEARDDLERCQSSPHTHQRACARLEEVCRRLGAVAAAADYAHKAAAGGGPDSHWADPWLADALQQGVGLAAGFRRVEQLESQGRVGLIEAVEFLHEMADKSPNYRVYVALGKDLALLGDHTGAEDALRQAVRLAPDKAQAHFYLSKVLWGRGEQRRKGGDAEAARKDYEESAGEARLALARQPDDGPTHTFLGLALKGLGRREEAAAAFRAAAACGGGDAEPYLLLGELLAEDIRAAAVFRAAAACGGGDAGPYLLLGGLLAEDVQAGEARAALGEAVRLSAPTDVRARDVLARLDKPK
jgi:tetratricopeptide (TPR) repeat protein